MNDDFLNKISKKTKVKKETIIELARKLSSGNMKDEQTLNDVIDVLSNATGKRVSSDLKDKIIKTVKEDKVPKNLDNLI
jgi:predicted nucleic-acid-binding protein